MNLNTKSFIIVGVINVLFMKPYSTPNPIDLKTALKVVRKRLKKRLRQHGFKAGLLVALAYAAQRKDLSIDFYLNALPPIISTETETQVTDLGEDQEGASEAMNVSLLAENPDATSNPPADANLANEYANLTYTSGSFATGDSKSVRTTKRRKQQAYIDRFADIARKEMQKYGIPASIILAQGLLESDAGESPLAQKNNNHFGMKCFSRTCKKGHCSNFTDDSHKDFFRIYDNAWESYRSHSHLLRGKRYRHLFKLDSKDYKGWARGLKKAGYATDKHYAEKLINLIEELDLHRYDR